MAVAETSEKGKVEGLFPFKEGDVSFCFRAPKIKDLIGVDRPDVLNIRDGYATIQKTEGEVLSDLASYMGQAYAIIGPEHRGSVTQETLRDFREKATFIGKREFDIATNILAQHWLNLASESNKVFVYWSPNDFGVDQWLALEVVLKMEKKLKEMPAQVRRNAHNRIYLIDYNFNKLDKLFYTKGKYKIIVLDNMRSVYLSDGFVRQLMGVMPGSEERKLEKIEINSVCAGKKYLEGEKDWQKAPVFAPYYSESPKFQPPYMYSTGYWNTEEEGFSRLVRNTGNEARAVLRRRDDFVIADLFNKQAILDGGEKPTREQVAIRDEMSRKGSNVIWGVEPFILGLKNPYANDEDSGYKYIDEKLQAQWERVISEWRVI